MPLRWGTYLISLEIDLSISYLNILVWITIWCSIFLILLNILLIVLLLIVRTTNVNIGCISIVLLILLCIDLLIIDVIQEHHLLLLVKFITFREDRIITTRKSWMSFHIFIPNNVLGNLNFCLLHWLCLIHFVKWRSSLLLDTSGINKNLLLLWLLLIRVILVILVILIILFNVDIRWLEDISKFFYFFMIIRVLFK